jgi:hypothetical protein
MILEKPEPRRERRDSAKTGRAAGLKSEKGENLKNSAAI